MSTSIQCGSRTLSFAKAKVMGILNVTPDSFSDGGRYLAPHAAVAYAKQMLADGADIIDVGGESTRPGAEPVSVQEELDRVLPVIRELSTCVDIPISIDTSHPEVMAEAVSAGACMINDVRALRSPGALAMAAELGVPVCLMHMQGEPDTMQENPHYGAIIDDITRFFSERIQACVQAGISQSQLILDPGFGFGKTLEHNLTLLKHLARFQIHDCPLLVGLSRKSMIGMLVDRPPSERLYGSLAATVYAVMQGARLIRAHDVGPTTQAVRVASAILES